MRQITWAMGWPMGQPKDEQPAPEMRCNATARYCVPKYDVASPWQQQKAARDPLVAGELEPHSKGAGRITSVESSLEPSPDGCGLRD